MSDGGCERACNAVDDGDEPDVPLSWLDLGVASGIVAVGATVQGSVGFGLGLIAAPILMLLDSRLVPGPLLVAALTLTLLMTGREWRAIDFMGLSWALGGRVAGVLAGAVTLTRLSSEAVDLLFGLLVLTAVGLSASGRHLAHRPGTLMGAGLLSGFMGTLASIGGPPIALLYQHADGPRIRSTLSVFFVAGTALSLLALRSVGRLGAVEVSLAAALVPGIVVGFLISGLTRRLLDRGYTRVGVLAVSAVAAAAVVLRSLAW